MLIENEFAAPADVERVWHYLLDVERIAPCMPGAEITEHVDERTWKGKVNVRFGPVSLAFAGTVEMTERDDAAHRVVLSARGMEQKGKGAATASVTSWLEPGDGSTTVKMQADITLTGAVAQLSRGLLPEVSRKLTAEFANCLAESMAAAGAVPAPAPGTAEAAPEPPATAGAPTTPPTPTARPAAAKPVSGLSLGLSAIWSLIVSFFRRLFGRGPRPPG
jgi:carbon monoxide dehydrogenase subunit G